MTVSQFPLVPMPVLLTLSASAADEPSAPKGVQKGQQTRAAIVQAALGLATQIGLEGLSIGAVAELMRMSKSGVFAHFGSREELQISVIREYYTRFQDEVFTPALAQERGLPRLRALFQNWMRRASVEIDSGCLYIGGAAEFDDRPGIVRDALVSAVSAWFEAVGRSVTQAKEAGHLRVDADGQQIAFETHGLILALHYEARFLRKSGSAARASRGFEHILARYAAPKNAALKKARDGLGDHLRAIQALPEAATHSAHVPGVRVPRAPRKAKGAG